MNDNEQRDELAREHEHLWLSDLRKHPNGEVRLFSADGKLISGTYAYQVTRSVDAMTQAATHEPRTITTVEELDALPFGSVLLDSRGISLHNNRFYGWTSSNLDRDISREMLERDGLPATVLHEPTTEATR